ncbi:Uncharacterised protein [Mycobacteroides abscessus subsp. abscessus]|nr:Uncharacterised protein [Mycobacteroides abscessus subsp. abscessus]
MGTTARSGSYHCTWLSAPVSLKPVPNKPGFTVATLTPCGSSSAFIEPAIASMACLVAQYTPTNGMTRIPPMEDVHTTLPDLRATIFGTMPCAS